MKVAFLVGDIVHISGGANVIIEYAAGLQRLGHEVVFVATQPIERPASDWHPKLSEVPMLDLEEAAGRTFDFAFATWWLSYFDLWKVRSQVYGYLNQSLESRFHPEPKLKELNRLTYELPLLFVTEARWLAELIQRVQSNARVLYLRNGLSREWFPLVDSVPSHKGPLRVLVEGPWAVPFKGVPETFELMGEGPSESGFEIGWLTSSSDGKIPVVHGKTVRIHDKVPIDRVHGVLRQYDVLIKLSRVEGVFGPPLEMFSQGGTALTLAVTGCDEYLVHGENALIVEPYNLPQINRYLKLLVDDPDLLSALRRRALNTARDYPDWPESVAQLNERLVALHAEGYTNAQHRSAIESIAGLASRWLEQEPAEIGQGEFALLKGYRRLKGSVPLRAAKRLLPKALKRSVRSMMTRALS